MAKNRQMINDLTQGNVTRQLIRFALPFMFSNLLQTLYATVDMIIVGQVVGSYCLSAVSIASSVMSFFTFLVMGFTTAGQIMIAQYIGAKDYTGIGRTVGTLSTLVLAGAVFFGAFGLALNEELIALMNTPEEAFDEAVRYLSICCAGMVFIFGYNTVSAVLRGMGESKRPFIFIAIAALTNLALDLLFVAGFGWKAAGAAAATVIGQAVSFIISVIYLYKKREQLGFDFKLNFFIPHGATVKNICRMGLPMALQSSAISLSSMFVTARINIYGVAASAITGIGFKLQDIVGIVTRAVSSAASTMIAQNMGAGEHERVKKLMRVSLVICVVTGVFFSIIFLIWPEAAIGLFDRSPDVMELAVAQVYVIVVGIAAGALMSPYYALINGIGFAGLSFVIGMLDGVVGRVGLSLLLGEALGFGLYGYWYGSALAAYITVIGSAAYYYSGKWKTYKILIKK